MLRIASVRGVGRSLSKSFKLEKHNALTPTSFYHARSISIVKALEPRCSRPLALSLSLAKPTSLIVQRGITTTQIALDQKKTAVGGGKVTAHPDDVTTTSGMTPALDFSPSENDDVDMLAGIKSDLKTVRETFALTDVPQEAYNIGLAGVLPYLATSLSTFYLAWDINYAHSHGEGFLMSGKTAELLLHIIEPLQVGYGAVIISFLGAIHWGLEFGGYGGYHGYRRYAIGVIAPAIAWPTILMPVEYALITQFLAFTYLYFVDAQATARGWAPSWYTTYRFILTFVVGSSLLLSLIGRGEISGLVGRPHGTTDRIQQLKDIQYDELELEEKEKQANLAKKEEAEDEDSDDKKEDESEDEE